jgi:signal transduction histidine kinase
MIVIHSLRLRLLVMTVIVSVVAIAAVAILSSRLTSQQFNRYLATDNATNLERLRDALVRHYQEHAGWAEVQSTIDRAGQVAGKGLILVDNQRKVIATSPAGLASAKIEISPDHRLNFEWRERVKSQVTNGNPAGAERVEEHVEQGMLLNAPHVVIKNAKDETVGTLYTVPVNLKNPQNPERNNESVFVGAVNRSFIIAGLVAAASALLVTIVLSRRILGPVEALTGAARRLENGDLSQRVEVQSKDEIGELAHAFNAMADGLERTEQLRRNLVNDVAHELRTPLTNIRCQIEALQDGLAVPNTEVLASLHEETMLLNRLINDLQELALAEAGQLGLRRGPVPVLAEIDFAVRAAQSQATPKEIFLQVNVPDDLPPLNADAERFRQILYNLLNNAVTHTPPKGQIVVRAKTVDSMIEITIADSGPGIAPEHLPFIFERFYRADQSRARTTGGAGLGLAIVKQLVEAQGGRVWAESEAGRGATFFVRLPTFDSPVFTESS